MARVMWLLRWVRDLALFAFLVACLLVCWLLGIEWGEP